MRIILLLPLFALPLAAAGLRAQDGCGDVRAVVEMARLRQELGTTDVMCVEFARGDVDGDGRDDAVLDIGYEISGMEDGRKSRLHVLPGNPSAPLLAEPDEERGAVSMVRIAGPEIRVETLEYRPDDPPCCPSRYVDLVLRVVDGQIIRVFEP
ncbi:MAG TPA: hypothetical protein VK358_18335 [Longimicrobium sp.]|nr:hypothetical protein [Longimicrobium sp.]